MKNKKELGQVFTPKDIVAQMLSLCGYDKDNILCKKILEPSFGDGAFLTEILKKLLSVCKDKNMNNDDVIKYIHQNIFGIEKDVLLYDITVKKLNCILNEYGITYFDWTDNLYCADTLSFNNFKQKFDIVIGNPPYVSIHNIDDTKILSNYAFVKKGMADLYICFFEKGISLLNDTGQLCYITPNSYFNSLTGETMRSFFIENNLIDTIIDFGHKQVFDSVTTYSCITLLNKQKHYSTIKYVSEDRTFLLNYKDFFLNNCYYFLADEEFRNIIRFSDSPIAFVKNGYATLNDNFFINSEIAKKSLYSINVVKSSTGEMYPCFYPYDKNGDIIELDTIEKHDQYTFSILEEKNTLLKKRSLSYPDKWYGFGRTQGIKDTYKNKYAINCLFRTIDDIKITHCPAGCGAFGGLYILTDIDAKTLLSIFKTDKFIKYCQIIGKYKNGDYYTISSKEMSKFLNYFLSN